MGQGNAMATIAEYLDGGTEPIFVTAFANVLFYEFIKATKIGASTIEGHLLGFETLCTPSTQ